MCCTSPLSRNSAFPIHPATPRLVRRFLPKHQQELYHFISFSCSRYVASSRVSEPKKNVCVCVCVNFEQQQQRRRQVLALVRGLDNEKSRLCTACGSGLACISHLQDEITAGVRPRSEIFCVSAPVCCMRFTSTMVTPERFRACCGHFGFGLLRFWAVRFLPQTLLGLLVRVPLLDFSGSRRPETLMSRTFVQKVHISEQRGF